MFDISINKANMYLVNKNYDMAVSELKKIIIEDPKNAYFYSTLSSAYAGKGEELDAFFSDVQWALLSNYKLEIFDKNNFFYSSKYGYLSNEHSSKNSIIVIVPVYNAEDTIQECVESLISQSYGDILIVAIDDCSTDNSPKILKQLEFTYPNLKVILSPLNLGTYNAINLGLYFIGNFEFGYFCIHGADDVMLHNKLELQIDQMYRENALASIAGYNRVDIKNKSILKTSQGGHSMVVYKREVFDKLGYYYDSRFGSDSEYWHRFNKCFGKNKFCKVARPLTNAYFGSSNLTSSNSDDSQIRLDFVSVFEKMHIRMSEEGYWYVGFDFLEKINPEFNKVICGVATIPGREKSLEETVESILPQVDKLIVYQNGFKEIYDYLINEKIEVISSYDTGIDMGDAGKFYKIDNYPSHYYFSIDDDLIYPDDYVEIMLKKLKKYNNSIIVTSHGRILKKDAKSYYKDVLETYRCLYEETKDAFVQFGGTGVMAFHTSKIKIKHDIFKAPNMADIWVGMFAQKEEVPILVIKHAANWIKYSDKFDRDITIYNIYESNDCIQNRTIKSYDLSRVVKPLTQVK